jgi:glycosyltransferase 2 family protein
MTTVDSEPVTADESPVGQRPPRTLKSLVIAWLRRLMIVAVVVGAGYYLATRWEEVTATIATIPWYSAVLSMIAVCVGLLMSVFSWRVIVNDLGASVGRLRGSQIYLVSQLGKYVPGSVWAYLLQMELGKKVGIPRARMFVSTLVQLGVSVVAMLALGVIALPRLLEDNPQAAWLYAVLPLALVALHPKVMTWGVNLGLKILRKAPLDHSLGWKTIGKTLGYCLLANFFMGAHLWLLATANGSFDPSLLLICVGTIAIGMLAGILFFIVPSGAGARDVLVALALTPAVGGIAAAAFAVASRVMFTVAELATAGISAGLVHYRDRRKAPVDGS